MIKCIWKYSLITVGGVGSILSCHKGKIVHVRPHTVDTGVELWIEVEPNTPVVIRSFVVYGTGHPIPKSEEHVHTWVEGAYIWHLYEVFDD